GSPASWLRATNSETASGSPALWLRATNSASHGRALCLVAQSHELSDRGCPRRLPAQSQDDATATGPSALWLRATNHDAATQTAPRVHASSLPTRGRDNGGRRGSGPTSYPAAVGPAALWLRATRQGSGPHRARRPFRPTLSRARLLVAQSHKAGRDSRPRRPIVPARSGASERLRVARTP